MKIYDFKNKKLYESNAVYTLSVEEFDANGNSIDQNSFEDTYSTLEDALEDSYELMTNCAAEEGYDEDDVEYAQNDDNVVFSTPDGKKWIFTASVKNNESNIVECGDMDESEKSEDSEKIDEEDNSEKSNDDDTPNESVAERFSKLRKMFESDESDDKSDETDDNDDKSDDSNDENGDNNDDDKNDDKDESSDEDEEMKAVIITVKKGDEDKCKEEMINAGIAEDDIEILDADDDAENIEIRIDVNSIMELKDYLAKKGVDLEEEIGGEIVDDSDEDSDNGDSDEENGDDENKEGDEEDFDFDNLGDLFGADEEE